MRLQRLSTLVLTLAVFTSHASAGGETHNWLAGDAIAKALAGKTIKGSYASGRAFTERYDVDGKVQYMEGGQAMGGTHV